MSKNAKISDQAPVPRPLGLSTEERRYFNALVADLRACPDDCELHKPEDHCAADPAASKQPPRRLFQIIVDALAIAVGLFASGAIIWMINNAQG